MEPPPPVAEDIYAVVDKRRKIKTRLQQFEALVAESSNKQQQQQPLEQKPVPPVRSSSTNSNSSTQSLSGYRPEIKPKPPLRVASMRKPEISPKPKNLQPRVAVGKSPTPSTPTPPPPPIEARRTKTLQNMSSTTLLPSTNTFYWSLSDITSSTNLHNTLVVVVETLYSLFSPKYFLWFFSLYCLSTFKPLPGVLGFSLPATGLCPPLSDFSVFSVKTQYKPLLIRSKSQSNHQLIHLDHSSLIRFVNFRRSQIY